MRYRIILEIDVETPNEKAFVRNMARELMDQTVTRYSSPVYLATERVDEKEIIR